MYVPTFCTVYKLVEYDKKYQCKKHDVPILVICKIFHRDGRIVRNRRIVQMHINKYNNFNIEL